MDRILAHQLAWGGGGGDDLVAAHYASHLSDISLI